MKSPFRLITVSMLVVCGLASGPAISRLSSAGIFVYSSLCQGSEDPAGKEIVLIRDYTGETAIYTRTEGPIMAPLTAYGPNVQIDDRTGHFTMRFVDADLGDAGVYLLEGTLSDQELDIGGEKLPRVRTMVSKLPACGK